jgi:hypothetical protein
VNRDIEKYEDIFSKIDEQKSA